MNIKKFTYILFASSIIVGTLHAQDNKTATQQPATTAETPASTTTTPPAPVIPVIKLSDNVTVKFGGFVRSELYFDSRTTVGAVEDLFGFFPAAKSLDANGKDKNDVFRSNLSTQATRFNALFTGPDVFNAKSTAFFEYDFSGGNNVNLRLRHAYVKLNWTKSELLVGKSWNPLAETIFPSVIGLHTGIPFRPFGRGDQLRLTLKPTSSLSLLFAALYQSEHKSVTYSDATGVTVGSTNDTKINSIPDLHFQLHYKQGPIFAGVISEFKSVKPTTVTTGTGGTYSTDETINSFAYGAFARYTKSKLTIQGSVIKGQNLSELFQQGGYAVKSFDAVTGAKTYTASNSISYWANITYGEKVIVGLFAGYQKNLGFDDNILTSAQAGGQTTFLGRWQNVDHIYRIAPSIKYTVGRITLAAELDYNVAAYGTIDYTNKGKVKDAEEISGIRGLTAITFTF